jgi:VanZ family protein
MPLSTKRVVLNWLSRWLPVLLWMGVIFLVSQNTNPYQQLPQGWVTPSFREEMIGRVSHVVEYGVLVLLVLRATNDGEQTTTRVILYSVGLSLLYALVDEIHQAFVPGRAFQLLDLSLDAVGILLGLGVWVMVKRILGGSEPAGPNR